MSNSVVKVLRLNEGFAYDHRIPMPYGKISYLTKAAPIEGRTNEDAMCIVHGDNYVFFAVADGMGGHKSGNKASQIAIEKLAEIVANKTAHTLSQMVGEIENIHQEVVDLKLGSGTTLTACWIVENQARFLSVGDSVGSIFSGKRNLLFKTLEHSPAGLALESGLFSLDDPQLKEEDYYLFNALGLPPLRIEVSGPIELQEMDYVLLSTDGFTDNLKLEELAAFLTREEDKRPLEDLETALANHMASGGKVDDATIIVYEN
ncbi:MAG: hypothetical protein CL677_00555 [Bdellovibrionaceae bacterium]|nr:hypothetical protein [Pseudobdellovibrionaceae bacterium]